MFYECFSKASEEQCSQSRKIGLTHIAQTSGIQENLLHYTGNEKPGQPDCVVEIARIQRQCPGEHDTLRQCWFNVGAASPTLHLR